jgi:putative transposase
MGRSGIYGHRQGMGIEEHLGWSVEVVKHPPNRGASGNHAAILMISTEYFEWVRLPAEPKRGRGALPRHWAAERTIGW